MTPLSLPLTVGTGFLRAGLYHCRRWFTGVPLRAGVFAWVVPGLIGALPLGAQSPYESSSEFARYAMKLRENALLKMEPQVIIPTTGRHLRMRPGRYPWKRNIVTTVFWVGEDAAPPRNPVANYKSSWDPKWKENFGGYDDPDPKNRRDFIPVAFEPRQNPFYVALPYNDVTRGRTKPEAPKVIPWFEKDFERAGKSVCKGRWVAIRKGNRVAYGQWEDCGPFRTDHWQYVFGNERPKPNLNRGAGLDVSPAIRDFIGMEGGKDVTDWRFVELSEVPPGPWRLYGGNNPFVQSRRRLLTRMDEEKSASN